jgi:integral membrane protein
MVHTLLKNQAAECQPSNAPGGRAAIRFLRKVALLEGASYLLLLGVAMPLKYLAGMPGAVRLVGSVHGGLFVLYAAAVIWAGTARRWPAGRWAANLVASLLPFGPFVMDGRLRREEEMLVGLVDTGTTD